MLKKNISEEMFDEKLHDVVGSMVKPSGDVKSTKGDFYFSLVF